MPDTKQPELSIERFSALVEAYGGDLERFPVHERTAAKALALRSKEAQQLLAAARVFDSVLAAARLDLPVVELEQALAHIPQRHAQERKMVRLLPFRSNARAGMAVAAAVVLGMMSGQVFGLELGDDSDQADIASLTFGDSLLDVSAQDEGGAP